MPGERRSVGIDSRAESAAIIEVGPAGWGRRHRPSYEIENLSVATGISHDPASLLGMNANFQPRPGSPLLRWLSVLRRLTRPGRLRGRGRRRTRTVGMA